MSKKKHQHTNDWKRQEKINRMPSLPKSNTSHIQENCFVPFQHSSLGRNRSVNMKNCTICVLFLLILFASMCTLIYLSFDSLLSTNNACNQGMNTEQLMHSSIRRGRCGNLSGDKETWRKSHEEFYCRDMYIVH